MRLLNTDTRKLAEFFDSDIPPYAILSHTWGNEEVSFLQMENHDEAVRSKAGFKKIVNFCALARYHGLMYGWVDSCCIDKRSSAELSEAISSMYRYYYNAERCLIHLEDVPAVQGVIDEEKQLSAIKSSRWFTRGWTLQELIAPKIRYFYAGDWSPIANSSFSNSVITDVTGVSWKILENRDFVSGICIGRRMSWASRRQTTRGEDMAYSLLGLFNIHMPIMYGEGARNAFKRLQNEIMKTYFDQTIFAWRANRESSGLLATSPADFSDLPKIGLWHSQSLSPFVMTNVGLSVRLCFLGGSEEKLGKYISSSARSQGLSLASLQCDIRFGETWESLMVYLELVRNARCFVNGKPCKAYRRVKCAEWVPVATKDLESLLYEDILVLEDEHYQLFKYSNEKRWDMILGNIM